jgi:hypothetical protein
MTEERPALIWSILLALQLPEDLLAHHSYSPST